MSVDKLLQNLATMMGFVIPDRKEAISKGLCAKCGQNAYARISTPAGMAEYNISGLDEVCYDAMHPEEDEVEMRFCMDCFEPDGKHMKDCPRKDES